MSGVYLAYDGSIHGDWVSHYAARLAAAHETKTLHLVHACEPTGRVDIDEKFHRIRSECRRLDADLELHVMPLEGNVAHSILAAIPAGPGSHLICGTRGRERKRGLLSGAVSERLLRSGHCRVMAVHVVQPGLLGLPRQLLLPVSGHPRGIRTGLPFLKLFAHEVSRLHVVHVVRVGRWRFRLLSHASAEKLRQPGQAHCERIEQEIREQLSIGPDVVDAHVVVSDDVPKEIVITANKTKSQLIFLGASERNLSERFFSGNPIEQVLRDASCDVAIYRGLA